MTTKELAQLLAEAFDGYGVEGSKGQAESFEEAGVLTNNSGLVLRFEDGSEFQVSVVQSRRGACLSTAELDALEAEATKAAEEARGSLDYEKMKAARDLCRRAAAANRAAGFDEDAEDLDSEARGLSRRL
jgi:hypothetical protein